MEYSDYERYKWETLAHLFHRFGIEGAWIEVKHLEPEDGQAQRALVRRVVLDLFDSGLIVGAFASRDEGYKLDRSELVSVPREVVDRRVEPAARLRRTGGPPDVAHPD